MRWDGGFAGGRKPYAEQGEAAEPAPRGAARPLGEAD